MQSTPWYKATSHHQNFGKTLILDVPHDVFSTLTIDEGTLLLLENLPAEDPQVVLDKGCGYGALGLPIAQRYKNAKFYLVA